MSPNLSSKHFAGNRLLYEQVIYNVLRLVGVARPGNEDSPSACRSLEKFGCVFWPKRAVFISTLRLGFDQHIE